jgi:hypothetical protein
MEHSRAEKAASHARRESERLIGGPHIKLKSGFKLNTNSLQTK